MPDTKITALTALTAADPANDVLPIVDVSDTTMAASGTTKKISINNVLGASGTATFSTLTVSGPATAQRFIPSSATVPSNGMYLPAANELGWAINSAEAMRLNSTGLGVGVTPSGGNRLMIQNTTDCTVVFKSSGANVNSAIDYVSNYGNHTIRKSGTAVWDFGVINDSSATPAFKFSNGTDRLVIDANGNLILQSSATPATLTTNGQLTVNATSNTNLRFSYRGSDGVTRVANITLA